MNRGFRRKHLPHEIPIWINPTKEAYFITIVCQPRGTNQLANPHSWSRLLQSIQFREDREDWSWRLILGMPDHLHGIVTLPKHFHLRKTITDWKRWTATKLGIVWQDGFFEHRLRTIDSAVEKADYIRLNPIRAGLVDHPRDWPYVRDWKAKDQP